MDIILIPGLWLDASSWSDVAVDLERAGHAVHPLTMPGVGALATESSDIGISDWVDAAVAAVDAVGGPVVVVGHSGGGNVAWGVADARPDVVTRAVFVDTVPPPSGFGISEFEVVDGVVPFPGWDYFPAEDVDDLDEVTRARTAPLAKSVPARVPTDEIALVYGARHSVPVTLLMGGMDRDSRVRARAVGPVRRRVPGDRRRRGRAHRLRSLAAVLGAEQTGRPHRRSGHPPLRQRPSLDSVLCSAQPCARLSPALDSVPHPESAVHRDDGA